MTFGLVTFLCTYRLEAVVVNLGTYQVKIFSE